MSRFILIPELREYVPAADVVGVRFGPGISRDCDEVLICLCSRPGDMRELSVPVPAGEDAKVAARIIADIEAAMSPGS